MKQSVSAMLDDINYMPRQSKSRLVDWIRHFTFDSISRGKGYNLFNRDGEVLNSLTRAMSDALDETYGNYAAALRRSTMAYPLRAVWRINDSRDEGSPIQFLISIPKKRLRHAVDRVKMRRRVREAYRLKRHDFHNILPGNIDLAIIYVADTLKDYHIVEKSMCRIFRKIYNEKDTEHSGVDTD